MSILASQIYRFPLIGSVLSIQDETKANKLSRFTLDMTIGSAETASPNLRWYVWFHYKAKTPQSLLNTKFVKYRNES